MNRVHVLIGVLETWHSITQWWRCLRNPPSIWEEGLGPHWEEIMEWSVGPDWKTFAQAQIPAKIRERTNLTISSDDLILPALHKIRAEWERRRT
jgi:hypothetical protein